jgi:hypothetical protein
MSVDYRATDRQSHSHVVPLRGEERFENSMGIFHASTVIVHFDTDIARRSA